MVHSFPTRRSSDLRSVVLHQRRRIPVYLNQSTADHILLRFSYCFVAPPGSDYPPILDNHAIEAGESHTIEGKGGPVALSAFILQHGNIPALGYRIADAAYTPDVSDIPPESWPYLQDLDLWIIDGLRYAGHPSHFSVSVMPSLPQAALWRTGGRNSPWSGAKSPQTRPRAFPPAPWQLQPRRKARCVCRGISRAPDRVNRFRP